MRYHESEAFISQGKSNDPVWRKLASPPTEESGTFVVVTFAANLDLNVGALDDLYITFDERPPREVAGFEVTVPDDRGLRTGTLHG